MRTIDQVKSDATARFNPNKGENGMVTRGDILDILEFYQDPRNEVTHVKAVLDDLSFVTTEEKDRILSDLLSYPVSYERN